MKMAIEIIIIFLLIAIICIRNEKIFGISLAEKAEPTEIEKPQEAPQKEENAQINAPDAATLQEAKEIFPDATEVAHTDKGVYEVKKNTTLLGFIMKSTPYSNDISGFMGPTPLLIGLDKDSKIVKVIALKNDETPAFFDRVKSAGLLDSWNGLKPAEVASKQVAAVSGATFSSQGIIGSIQARMAVTDIPQTASKETHQEAQPNAVQTSKTDWYKIIANVFFILLLCATIIGFFKPGIYGKGRNILMVASILVLAFWQGRILSMAQFLVWIVNGIPVVTQWTILLLFILSIALPLIFGKAFYCAWVCPFGATQMLLGELNKKHKIKLGPAIAKWLQMLRAAILFVGLLAMGIGLSFDFSDIEAFTVFHPQTAPMAALVIGLASLVLSIWIPRPWCRFLCPLGELLEIVRRKSK